MKKVLAIIGIILALIFAMLFFVLRLMTDQFCKIEIQNGNEKDLIIKTYLLLRYDSTLSIDSIRLKHNNKLEIGNCLNGSLNDTLNIKFDAIGIYDSKMNLKIMTRSELIKFLLAKEKNNCATFLIN
jgi:hypothetical protein